MSLIFIFQIGKLRHKQLLAMYRLFYLYWVAVCLPESP